jgi:thiamine pyrophosphate-dependent acetolactate synthase large subunit-like protein
VSVARTVAQTVAQVLAELGVGHAFGVVGSGNFHVTNALRAAGVPFVAARHECGAATMADVYARISGRVSAVTLHQGCGLTNALTGITEAAKSRTPVVVLAADVTEPRSNFYVDQDALAEAVGAIAMRVDDPEQAAAVTTDAFHTAAQQRRTVLLNLPLHVQERRVVVPLVQHREPAHGHSVSEEAVEALVAELRRAERPVFIAGRGARGAESRTALEDLADQAGALLATSAVAKGLFRDNPWSLDVSGGFASPLAAELIGGADLVVAWGCALNMWTTRQGTLISKTARIAQVDLEEDALGRHRAIDLGVVGGVAEVAAAAMSLLGGSTSEGYRTDEVRDRIAGQVRWADVAYEDTSTASAIDPRTFTLALDDLLPREPIVGVDSGNFRGYPSMFLSVPDDDGFCFTQAYQSIGLGLATTIGAALARPDRLPVAALGDGGALMAAAELETVARLGLPMLVVVYNDAAYGAEVHHFGPDGDDLDTVRFPPTDIAAIAEGYGFAAVTVRGVDDLAAVKDWVDGDRGRPLLIDAKVTSDQPSWWLEEAFRGH